MKHTAVAAPLLLGCVLCIPCQAETIYRCGSQYSSIPCPNAQTLQTNPEFDAAAKTQTDQRIAREKALAKTVEKERLQRERDWEEERTPAPARKKKIEKPKREKKKAKASNTFTAKVPQHARP